MRCSNCCIINTIASPTPKGTPITAVHDLKSISPLNRRNIPIKAGGKYTMLDWKEMSISIRFENFQVNVGDLKRFNEMCSAKCSLKIREILKVA